MRVNPKTVSRWIDSGVLPCWRTCGGHRRVDRGDVERLLRQQSEPRPMVPLSVHASPSASGAHIVLTLVAPSGPQSFLLSLSQVAELGEGVETAHAKLVLGEA